jgi:integrase
MTKLTARKVQTIRTPGEYGDGDGLYLLVGPSGSRSWVLRTLVHGKRRKFGLGSAKLIGLAEAREEARSLRKVARAGGDPATLRNRQTVTFWEAAQKVHEQLLPTWKNAKHAETWLATVKTNAKPLFGDRPIETVSSSDVLKALAPIWVTKHETASRLKQRLSSIFDWAKSAGHYPHENPVNGLKMALPQVKRQVKHLAALDWREVPNLMEELIHRESVSARTLEFIILTAARSGEARGACWSEINDGVWTVPASRMKRGIEHRVPLSYAAQTVIDRVRGLSEELVFPSVQMDGRGKSKPQSVMVFKSLLGRMERVGFTVHGFRSSFRDWASESARADREVAEAALSHATGNEVERAYARSDLFERRIALMDSWARHCAGTDGEVVRMVR